MRYWLQINTNERDGGVLVGNWSGKYDDGVAPHAWNGSTAILEEFLKKRKGVKFGQCWTFAAVATTGNMYRAGVLCLCFLKKYGLSWTKYEHTIST